MQYLGHLISGKIIYLLKEKVENLLDLACLGDVTKTNHLIGLASYYRKCIALHLSNIVKSLTELQKKKQNFELESTLSTKF